MKKRLHLCYGNYWTAIGDVYTNGELTKRGMIGTMIIFFISNCKYTERP